MASQRQIIKSLNAEYREMFRKFFRRNYARVRSKIKPLIFDAIYDCPEMEEARSGDLKYALGLDFDPTLVISWAVSDTMRLKYTPTHDALFSFEITVQPGKHDNLYALNVAYQMTEKGAKLPWLK